VDAGDLVFCSSGTEAVNLALLGAGRRLPPGRSVVTWAAEHQSVLGAVRQLQLEGRTVHVLGVDGKGLVDLADLPGDAGLVSLGLANNEVGTVQPVAEAVRRARALGALVHLDCCQGPRWLRPPLELADLAAFSGHKLGAGGGSLLFVRRGLRLQPLQYGGPQEWGRRAGREDVATAAAVAAALEVTARDREARSAAVKPLAERLREALVDVGGRPTGAEPRLPNFATAAFRDRRGEDMLLALDLAGVAASSGSACASGSLDPSHVLLAMGFSLEEALGSLRLTAGYTTTDEDVERMFHVLHRLAARA
jgi:cysteine desulfurase